MHDSDDFDLYKRYLTLGDFLFFSIYQEMGLSGTIHDFVQSHPVHPFISNATASLLRHWCLEAKAIQ